jgi:hypothetical protein
MKNLKDTILHEASEIEIFERYLGVQIKLGRAMVSPLRQEKHPSFNVYQSESNGKIYYKDFGDERGDCFKFVMELHGCTFPEALQLVAQDLGIDTSKKEDLSGIRRMAKKIRIPQMHVNPRKVLPYARLEWNELLMTLWNKGGVRLEVLQEYNTWPVEKIKIPKRDGSGSFILYSKDTDPMYCFDYEDGVKKFYRPKAPDKKYKFISNLRKGDIFGLKQLKDHVQKTGKKERLVMICAGQKDCLSLFGNTGIRGIALNSESAGISSEFFVELMQYAENILVCYDNDETGIKHAQKVKDEIGIDNIDLGLLAPANIVNDIFDYFANGYKKEDYLRLIETKIC